MSHKVTRKDFTKISWTATNNLEPVDARMLWLLGTGAKRWVHPDWLKAGDRVKITVEKLPKRGSR